MLQRCRDPHCDRWERYGGRGIRVCPDWQQWERFRDWAIDHGWQEHLIIDRIDVDGDYCPANCRWVTRIESARNRGDKVLITAFGETKTIADWVDDRRCVVKRTTLERRLRTGMAPEEAMTRPPRTRGNPSNHPTGKRPRQE
jgi:hypothetical protein